MQKDYHLGWIQKVGKKFYEGKGLDLNIYVRYLLDQSVPLDELGILIVARMYHRHIAIVLKNSIWCTRKDGDFTKCEIKLAFQGGVLYCDTATGPAPFPLVNVTNQVKPQKSVLNLSKKKTVKKTRKRSSSSSPPVPKKKRRTKVKPTMRLRSAGPSIYSPKFLQPAKKTSPKPKSKPVGKPKPKPKPKPPKPESEPEPLPEPEPKPPTTDSEEIEQNSLTLTLNNDAKTEDNDCDLNSENGAKSVENAVDLKRVAAPTDLTEKDTLKHLSEISDLSSQKDESSDDESQQQRTPPPKTVVETKDGLMDIAHHGLPKRQRKSKHIKCPVCDCDNNSQLACNSHMKSAHPDHKYICDKCNKRYDTYNAWYKHTQTHYVLPHKCEFCEKRFLFPYQKANHEKLHTKKDLIPCTWRGCKRKFTSKKSMFQHTQSHINEDMGTRWVCDACPADEKGVKPFFYTIYNFNQHKRGSHGAGFLAPCGYVCRWPSDKVDHQKNCDKCKAIIADRTKLPDNPRVKTFRKRRRKTVPTRTFVLDLFPKHAICVRTWNRHVSVVVF